jgi:uncharacterized protein (DUF433 family)
MSDASEVIAGFTDDQAARLTGVSLRQLRYWANDGFFVPSISLGGEGAPKVHLYSFRDLVCLKVLGTLRNEARIKLAHLRGVKDRLAHLGEDMWAKTTLYILGRRVVFDNPVTGEREDAISGQGVLQIPLKVISGDMAAAVRAMRARGSNEVGQIDIRRAGRKNPVVAGTRIPVRTIHDFAEAGYNIQQIVEQYPSLTEADVKAALAYKLAAA